MPGNGHVHAFGKSWPSGVHCPLPGPHKCLKGSELPTRDDAVGKTKNEVISTNKLEFLAQEPENGAQGSCLAVFSSAGVSVLVVGCMVGDTSKEGGTCFSAFMAAWDSGAQHIFSPARLKKWNTSYGQWRPPGQQGGLGNPSQNLPPHLMRGDHTNH